MGKGRFKFSGPGTFVEKRIYESSAYLALNGFAPQLLILILGKRKFENIVNGKKQEKICINCESLNFTYAEAKKLGITIPRLTRAFDDLLAKGFIKINHQGGGYKQDKSTYELIDKWQYWRPGDIIEKREKDTRQLGFRRPKRESKKE